MSLAVGILRLHFEVYNMTDLLKGANTVDMRWVLIKKNSWVNKIAKVWPVCTPTAIKISIKLLSLLAANTEKEIRITDMQCASLQIEEIVGTVYIKPPVEVGLPANKGELDNASRVYILKHTKKLNNYA